MSGHAPARSGAARRLERAFRAGRDPDRRALEESDTAFLESTRPTLARALEALGRHTHRPA